MTEIKKRKSESTRSRTTPAEVLEVVRAAQSKQASDVVLLDLRGTGAFTDHFVICSARNRRQAKAVADAVEAAIRSTGGHGPSIEGYGQGDWILLDAFDFVVHVFTPDTRTFYDLERLWGDAVRTVVDEPSGKTRRPRRPAR